MFAVATVAEVKALACQLPAETGVPLSRWSHAELAVEAAARGIVAAVSASTVRRWLDADVIKPWQGPLSIGALQRWIPRRSPLSSGDDKTGDVPLPGTAGVGRRESAIPISAFS